MTIPALDPNSACRAAAYLRVSSADQQSGLRQQLRKVKHYIKSMCPHWRLIGTYSDNGKSWSQLGTQPGIQQLLHDITTGRLSAKVILIVAADRLGRDVALQLALRNLLESKGVRVVAIDS